MKAEPAFDLCLLRFNRFHLVFAVWIVEEFAFVQRFCGVLWSWEGSRVLFGYSKGVSGFSEGCSGPFGLGLRQSPKFEASLI
ncbi:hypothetical protein L596_020076 [Steinernema carpocapsae]|uniref:Uncharacterized protein n=1 Tax=Steinernema carpocapsae TaxID=34508 RepID=A0A4U5MTA4_STECR|nr:hypothetical protein L596_020076 [Steinernema carpocapsae]